MTRVIIQASSTAWSGGADLCMNPIDGHPAIVRTIQQFLDASGDISVVVAAPEFDQDGGLPAALKGLPEHRVAIYFGHDASPLMRMVAISEDLGDDDYIIRADGLHFPVDAAKALEMISDARSQRLDCMKFPDDFPVQFASDVYRVGALRRLAALDPEPQFHVHPKYYMMSSEDFGLGYCKPPTYDDDHLARVREIARTVYIEPRLEVNEKRIAAGDQLSFHYELARDYLAPDQSVIDIACGMGYGTRMLAGGVAEVKGCDLEPKVVDQAISLSDDYTNISFEVQDVTDMTFDDASFDALVSMETVEHVDDDAYIDEIARVLKPGGRLILSTPQNALGHIPVNAEHIREYSLEAISVLVERHFEIVELIGIKQGRIIVPDSPLGSNIMVIARKN